MLAKLARLRIDDLKFFFDAEGELIEHDMNHAKSKALKKTQRLSLGPSPFAAYGAGSSRSIRARAASGKS